MTTITLASLVPLLPVLVTSSAVVLLMLLVAFVRSHGLTLVLALAATLAAMATLPLAADLPQYVTPLLLIDNSVHFYWSMILLCALVCMGISHGYIKNAPSFREEWYLLILISATGGMVLAASSHMASLFIGLELLSVPLYGLAAFALKNKRSLEAGFKYLVLSATASAFLLFGIALVYAQAGSLFLTEWSRLAPSDPLVVLGCALMLVGLGFKLSWVPFHTWTPDVYQGAPMPVTAFLATASKVAVVAIMVRLFIAMPAWHTQQFVILLMLVAGASIILGNAMAINQNSLKRLLAYSSIAHFGYLIIALIAVHLHGVRPVLVYLITYVVASLCAFAVLTSLTWLRDDTQGDDYSALRGLYHRHPFLAVALAVSLISLAGVPLTAGFIGKFVLFAAGVATLQWILLLVLIGGSAIGIYFYMRAVSVLFQPADDSSAQPVSVPALNSLLIVALLVLTLLLGVWPSLII